LDKKSLPHLISQVFTSKFTAKWVRKKDNNHKTKYLRKILQLNIHFEPIFMRRALDLAKIGALSVSPNPCVGAVLVHQSRIIGEGWHEQYGQAHAEVNAINSVKTADRPLIAQSTFYVTLEPCHHFGKTPPCVDLILLHRIPRVVIACSDPNALVAGKSIAKLRAHGVEVVTGVLADESAIILKPFFKHIATQQPFVTLKWAQSSDGFIGKIGQKIQISHLLTQRLTHRWRAEADAIMVGTQTVLTDNPSLNNRFYYGKSPLRVYFDRTGKTFLQPDNVQLSDGQPTIVVTEKNAKQSIGNNVILLFEDFDKDLLKRVIQRLCVQNRVGILLVEGGAALHQSFLNADLWDEIRIFQSPNALGEGVKAANLPNGAVLTSRISIGTDECLIYQKKITAE
jgi:diaminohydroxyphosphoribosylaminopyrimidine deaminase / 5-amino-6-(5-phosphoribosylamino)uracil reductase